MPPSPPTVGDNIRDMARLVASLKRDFRLNENTIMRIVDMNLAMAREDRTTPDFPFPENDADTAAALGIDFTPEEEK